MLDTKRRYLATLLVPFALAAACGDDDDANNANNANNTNNTNNTQQDIVAVAVEAGLTELTTAATAAGLADTLQSAGPFTVFAPTNAAFAALGDAAPSDPGLLANVLLNHVVSGELDSAAVLGATELTTAAKTTIAVDASATPPTVGGAPLTDSIDVGASNGIVHVIDQVIVPPTIAAAAGALPDLSSLNAAVGAASPAVADTLAGSGPITVFAPVNSAFEGVDLSGLSQGDLDAILTYHVATGQTLAGNLEDGATLTMASGGTVTVQISGEDVTLTDGMGNTINVIETDIRLLNGTVHLIDGILMPEGEGPGTIVDVADAAGLSTLLSVATTAGLADTLASPGPFTVFAPTNAAFEALGDAAPSDPDLLANVLLNHVVPGTVDSGAVLGATSLDTAANTSVEVDAAATPPTVGGAPLDTSNIDVAASNGIVHIIDQVIVPPTIDSAVAATPDLSTLLTAVGAASPSVLDTLAGPGPITVFAPINSAFTGIDLGSLSQAQVDGILTYHVVTGQTLAGDLQDGATITMASGGTVTVQMSGEDVSLVDAMGNTVDVVGTDIRLLNGVVHLIDGVLMPQ